MVVDIKTAGRKYTDLQVAASLQLSIYGYATAMNGLTDETHFRLRFDVLTKTKQPGLHRYRTTRDRAANVRLYRLATGVLGAVAAGVFPPRVGWPLPGLSCPEPVLGVGVNGPTTVVWLARFPPISGPRGVRHLSPTPKRLDS